MLTNKYFDQFRANMFDKRTLEDWGTYIKLAIPTTTLFSVEWWAFEFIVLFAGALGVTELTAQVAIL